jgi:two-component system LytT family response regulator
VQCFGNFRGLRRRASLLHFEFSRTKELFAYLVDRCGASVEHGGALLRAVGGRRTIPERYSCASIWRISRTRWSALGAADVFLKTRNSFAVDKDALDCDFYSFLRGDGLRL